MRKRICELIEHVTNADRCWRDMEDLTGIPSKRWQNVSRGLQRPTSEMIEAIGHVWPQFAFWLVTGRTDAASGHTSPAATHVAQDA
ncbi:hypothetical protein PAN31117_05362 [Pandoraea anapnoica]|uniref:DNA-binding protein n=1 Tax=Pandoraea anapnoica TaxID=2508301 RepID=A0A5E5AVR1_9BURK|nr:DNA-binding protein [Pandoraea anapnoica]VVE76260.1 hypothetical protein PAN31117_05362 [Pandoraea anapnoica]